MNALVSSIDLPKMSDTSAEVVKSHLSKQNPGLKTADWHLKSDGQTLASIDHNYHDD